MTIHPLYIGCDVSKHHLDLFDPRTNTCHRIANAQAALEAFVCGLEGEKALVVMEATGAYDRLIRHVLSDAAIDFVRVNPTRARRYAEAAGFLAKTDAIDARMLAGLGEAMKLSGEAPPDRDREALGALQKRRDQLVQMRADEKKRAHDAPPEIAASISDHIDWLDDQIKELEDQISVQIKTSSSLKEEARRLQSAPGIGPVTASVLLALMPELGRTGPKQIASLAGLAPMNQESGAFRGVRRIKGGRQRVRQALYMAALGAIRTSLRFSNVYDRIVEQSKAKKVAIIAVARKLLVTLNAMIRDKTMYA